jgi:hypothetical protein
MDTEHQTHESLAGRPAGRRCVQCGTVAEVSWGFCGTCGASLPQPASATSETGIGAAFEDPGVVSGSAGTVVLVDPAPPVPVPAERPRGGRRSRLALTLYALAAVLLLALIAVAGYVYQQTRNDLANTRAELAATQAELDTTVATLSETERSLADSRDELADTAGQLQQTRSRLRTAQRELAGLEGSLENAQDRLDLQANQIETLKSCLDGVTNAMGYAAYSNYGAAIASLEAVEVSCNRAYDLF